MGFNWGSVFIKGGDHSKRLKLQSYRSGQRVPVFQASALLGSKQHQFFLTQLQELSGLPEAHYHSLYEPIVHRFVEFVQVLPSRADGALCDLMNEGLLRGMNALRLLIQTHSDATFLERYAVFTASLLSDVSKVIVNQTLFITDETGAFLQEWQPLSGSLCEMDEAQYYKIMPLAPLFQRISQTLTTLLARQLMPVLGFDWIASEPNIFMDWLAALRGEVEGGVGRLSHITQLTKQALDEKSEAANTLPALTVELGDSPATEHADAFMEWLKKGIADKSIKVNTADAAVHVVEEGVFIEKAGVFRQFADYYGRAPVNYFSVFQQFGNLMGFAKLSGDDYRYDQYFSEYPGAQQASGNLFGAALHTDRSDNKNSSHKDTTPEVKPSKDMFGATQRNAEGVAERGNANRQKSATVAQQNSIKEGILIRDLRLIFASADVPLATPFLRAHALHHSESLPSLPQQSFSPENTVK